MCECCVGLAATCHSMLRSLKIWSANCRSNQKKLRGIWWVRDFKMVSASLRKKSDQICRSRSSFSNLKKVCKKFFFHADAIALPAYTEQLLPRGKAAVCCILPCGIVWTHLNMFNWIPNSAIIVIHSEIILLNFKLTYQKFWVREHFPSRKKSIKNMVSGEIVHIGKTMLEFDAGENFLIWKSFKCKKSSVIKNFARAEK